MKCMMFRDAELLCMNSEAIKSLIKVTDDYIAKEFDKLFNSLEFKEISNDEVLGKPLRNLEDQYNDIIDTLLASSKIKNIKINEISLFSFLTTVVEDVNIFNNINVSKELSEAVNNISMNMHSYVTTIPKRKKEDYDKFIVQMLEVSKKARYLNRDYNIIYNPNFIGAITNNKALFYNVNEKPRSTGIGGIVNRESTVRIINEGLKYEVYRKEKGISVERGYGVL